MNRTGRYVYLVGVWLFLAGVVIQVFLAGMVVVARQIGWSNHISLGHILAGPLLIMLISMYVGRMPGKLKWMTWALFGVLRFAGGRAYLPACPGAGSFSIPSGVSPGRFCPGI